MPKVALKLRLRAGGEWCDEVFLAFRVSDGDPSMAEVDVFDAQAEAVQKLGQESVRGVG